MIVKVGNKSVNFEKKGIGEPILFVHGWGGTIKSLETLANLASKKYQTIILDLPGFGKSDPPGKDWGVEEYAQFLVEFLKRLRLKKSNYFGHSFGGSIGIYIAACYSIIDKLMLCNSSFKRESKVSPGTRKLKTIGERLPFLQFLEPYAKKIYYRIFFPNSDLIKFPQLEANFRKIMTQDLTPYLPRINQQTLILWGEGDKDTPVNLAYELKEKIKNSSLKIFPNISHSLPLKCPNIVFQEIRKFI